MIIGRSCLLQALLIISQLSQRLVNRHSNLHPAFYVKFNQLKQHIDHLQLVFKYKKYNSWEDRYWMIKYRNSIIHTLKLVNANVDLKFALELWSKSDRVASSIFRFRGPLIIKNIDIVYWKGRSVKSKNIHSKQQSFQRE